MSEVSSEQEKLIKSLSTRLEELEYALRIQRENNQYLNDLIEHRQNLQLERFARMALRDEELIAAKYWYFEENPGVESVHAPTIRWWYAQKLVDAQPKPPAPVDNSQPPT